MNAYLGFCRLTNITPFPASHDNLLRYVAYLARSRKANTVRQYLSSLRFIHLDMGFKNPTEQNWALETLLKGIKRAKGGEVTPKEPITPDILLRLHRTINPDDPIDATFWAVCLTMFFGLLRKSNVMPPSASHFDPSKHLTRQDFAATQEGLVLVSRWAKNNQFRTRKLQSPLPAMPGHPLCPVSAVGRAFQLNPSKEDQPAFTVPGSGGPRPLLYPAFLSILRQKLHLAGFDPQVYAAHSFRRGGATWAFAQGLPGEVIRALGDWHSDAYLAYITVPLHLRFSAMAHFAANLPY